MKTSILTIAFAIFSAFYVNAQNGAAINSTGAAADPSAMLDVSSSNKGVLIPRVTEAERLLIASPARGLMVYQIDNTYGFWYYDGSAWTTFGDNLGNHIATDSLDMTNRKIKNLATCTQNLDAANKEYVDNAVAAGGGGGSTKPSMISNESSSAYTYSDAVQYCENLTEGGYTDWKMPSFEEISYFAGLSAAATNFLWTKSVAEGREDPLLQNYISYRISDGKFINSSEMNNAFVGKGFDASTTSTTLTTLGTITPSVSGNWLKVTHINLQGRNSSGYGSYFRIKYVDINNNTTYSTTFYYPSQVTQTLFSWDNIQQPLMLSSISLEARSTSTSYTTYGYLSISGFEINPAQKVGNTLYARCVR